MRLGQIARQLDITPKEIVAYFAEKGIEINSHANSKLDEALEQDVMDFFGDKSPSPVEVADIETPPPPIEIVPPTPKQEEIMEVESTPPTDVEPSEETTEITQSHEEDTSLLEIDTEVKTHAEPELIKAPKIELPGLKVVGKIELPEPKKIEVTEEPPQEKPKSTRQQGDQIITHHRNNARKRLTEEEREAKRLRNKRAKEKRLKRALQKEKELEEQKIKAHKANHYKQKLTTQTVAPKKVKKKAAKAVQEVKRPIPKTILGKFWRWLNT